MCNLEYAAEGFSELDQARRAKEHKHSLLF